MKGRLKTKWALIIILLSITTVFSSIQKADLSIQLNEYIDTDANTKTIKLGNVSITAPYETTCVWGSPDATTKHCETVIIINNSRNVNIPLNTTKFNIPFDRNVNNLIIQYSTNPTRFSDPVLNTTCIGEMVDSINDTKEFQDKIDNAIAFKA